MNAQNKKLIASITDYANSLDLRCQWIRNDLTALTSRPEWTTEADDALAYAEAELSKTLLAIAEARKVLTDKPLETV